MGSAVNNDWMRENFLDMPNKMYPGTWVVVGIVLAAILGGFTYLLVRLLKSRVPWKKLPGYPSASYFGKDHEPDTALLVECLKKTQLLLSTHCGPRQSKWTSEAIVGALRNIRIYVMNEDKWVDEWGRKVAGIQAGRNIILGRDLAAFLHECAHRCEEVIDRERDMAHATWEGDGIRAAVDEFSAWLSAQKPA